MEKSRPSKYNVATIGQLKFEVNKSNERKVEKKTTKTYLQHTVHDPTSNHFSLLSKYISCGIGNE